MFNKVRCSKCMYHSLLSGGTDGLRNDSKAIVCLYNGWSRTEGNMVLRNGKVFDRRGTDPENCQLFEVDESGFSNV